MARKRRKLQYEDPVTPVELTDLPSGRAGRRLRRRLERSGRLASEAESQALVEQATGFLAERFELSIDEARDMLIQDAATRGLTMREAAERILRQHGERD